MDKTKILIVRNITHTIWSFSRVYSLYQDRPPAHTHISQLSVGYYMILYRSKTKHLQTSGSSGLHNLIPYSYGQKFRNNPSQRKARYFSNISK